jgi:hypothetical protein
LRKLSYVFPLGTPDFSVLASRQVVKEQQARRKGFPHSRTEPFLDL